MTPEHERLLVDVRDQLAAIRYGQYITHWLLGVILVILFCLFFMQVVKLYLIVKGFFNLRSTLDTVREFLVVIKAQTQIAERRRDEAEGHLQRIEDTVTGEVKPIVQKVERLVASPDPFGTPAAGGQGGPGESG